MGEIPIPLDIAERTPLMRTEWMASVRKMRERDDAPLWNVSVGDRIRAEDLEWLRGFDEELKAGAAGGGAAFDRAAWASRLATRSDYAARALSGIDADANWESIPLMERVDIRDKLREIIPRDESLDRLIVNPTSGTTGIPVKVPSSIRAQGAYDPLIQLALGLNGVRADYGPGVVAAIQLCRQARTIVYNCVHSFLEGAGFAKVNLDAGGWRRSGHAKSWIEAMESVFLSGDPLAWSALLDAGIQPRPRAFLSTAMRLEAGLREELEKRFCCPVVDFYSSSETGPMAATVPDRPGEFLQLPHDIYLEVVDDQGCVLAEGETGEIAVTGGRNPYVPLLRYRTGDRESVSRREGRTWLTLSETRRPLLFSLPGGRELNPVDVARVMRSYPVRFHQCIQGADGSFRVRVAGEGLDLWSRDLEAELCSLLGRGVTLAIEALARMPEGKLDPYIIESRSE